MCATQYKQVLCVGSAKLVIYHRPDLLVTSLHLLKKVYLALFHILFMLLFLINFIDALIVICIL